MGKSEAVTVSLEGIKLMKAIEKANKRAGIKAKYKEPAEIEEKPKNRRPKPVDKSKVLGTKEYGKALAAKRK